MKTTKRGFKMQSWSDYKYDAAECQEEYDHFVHCEYNNEVRAWELPGKIIPTTYDDYIWTYFKNPDLLETIRHKAYLNYYL